MNEAIKNLLTSFGEIQSIQDEHNALQEIIQRITLLGLHRAGFFKIAAFYGGTALRILYSLDRFSEDLDFCLVKPNPDFLLSKYFINIKDELARFDFDAEVTEKRGGKDVIIESAFVKKSTYQALLAIDRDSRHAQHNQLIKVRIEVDKLNPSGAVLSQQLVTLPIPFLVQTLNLPSLFAGKIHAILARSYLNRVKGRDYYDFSFFITRNTPVNLTYLEAKLRDSGHYKNTSSLTKDILIELLRQKFQSVDFKKAKEDVLPFVSAEGLAAIDNWSKELFEFLAEKIIVE